MKYNYIYRWGNNPMRAKYKGKLCAVLATGKKRNCLVEFEDGHRMITDQYAVKPAPS